MRFKFLGAATAAVAAFVFLRWRFGIREDLDWADVTKPGNVIDIDGYGVHYTEMGTGPAILLIHGFGGHTYSYRHMMPVLARDHRVVAVDLKGYGYSERDAGAGLSFTDQVTMLRGLADRLAIERMVVVGHSMGGAVAQRFAATYPEMVEALVLVASVGGNEHARRARRPMLVPAVLLRPMMPLLARFAATRLFRMSFYDPAAYRPEVLEEYLRPARIRGSMDGLLASIRDRSRDSPVDFSRIEQPVLLLAASDDAVVPMSAALRLREQLPQARLVVIDRAGHLMMEERPEECTSAIGAFLSEFATSDSASQIRDGMPVGS